MNSALLSRSLGVTSPQDFATSKTSEHLRCLQAAPKIHFDGGRNVDIKESSKGVHVAALDVPMGTDVRSGTDGAHERPTWAHKAGVNCLAIDSFEGRYMLSGGASAEISLWNLDPSVHHDTTVLRPIGRVEQSKSSGSHQFGITHVSFYAFDSGAFLSSSYDHSLKIYSTENMEASATFGLDSVVYSHAMSPIADHLLVACATQHSSVRLIDLLSGANTHSLAGHKGSVLSVAWSPLDENILASAGADGTVRLWDIRRSAGCLGVMDFEDAVGIVGEDGLGKNARQRDHGKAHVGASNGVAWTDDGKCIVSAGHDERVRVWDVATGANALSHFGPTIKNTNFSTLLPLLVPSSVTKPNQKVMLYPNEKEILMFDLLEGTLLKRLRVSNSIVAQAGRDSGQRNVRTRVTSLAWRSGTIEFYSAHTDGIIRAWKPRNRLDDILDKEETLQVDEDADDGRKRKRETLGEIFQELTKQKITFT